MVAVGEEFAPIKSLIEHAINLDIRQALRLFWVADKSTGHYLENHCRSWEEVLDDYRYIPLNIAGIEPDGDEIGRLLEAIGREVDELDKVDIYVAGPAPFQHEMERLLVKRGAEGTRIFFPRRRSRHNELAEND